MQGKKRILIADPASSTIRTVFNSPKAAEYEIRTVETATECLSQVVEFKPHLVIIELLVPEMHGLEVLKRIKSHKESATVGTVIASSLTMVQNYNAALALGVDYFLVKPFNADHFFWVVEEFFKGSLKPDEFAPKLPHYESNACYNPTSSAASSYMKFWGTRGSTSVAGPQYVQYGGNTACLELKCDNEIVIIDAGTGLRELGDHIDVQPGQKINLIIGHTHWDHITGFPFFAPLYNKDCTLAIWAPVGYEKSTEELFHDMLSFGYFPVRLEELYAKLEFHDLRDGSEMQFGDLNISCHHAKHPGPTLCFKIKSPRQTIGYVTDNEVLLGYHGHPASIGKDHFLLEPHLSLIDFLSDCHLLIHEAQYLPSEYHDRVGWGHSSISNATSLVKNLSCNEWIVTHHDPKHTDEILQDKLNLHRDILNECNIDTKLSMAFDGLTLPL